MTTALAPVRRPRPLLDVAPPTVVDYYTTAPAASDTALILQKVLQRQANLEQQFTQTLKALEKMATQPVVAPRPSVPEQHVQPQPRRISPAKMRKFYD